MIGCWFAPRPQSYDHATHHQLRAKGTPFTDFKLQIWDFVVMRADGSGVRLHPRNKTKDVECFDFQAHSEDVEPPPKGVGKSWGRGTYKHYRELGIIYKVKFGARKNTRTTPQKPSRSALADYDLGEPYDPHRAPSGSALAAETREVVGHYDSAEASNIPVYAVASSGGGQQ